MEQLKLSWLKLQMFIPSLDLRPFHWFSTWDLLLWQISLVSLWNYCRETNEIIDHMILYHLRFCLSPPRLSGGYGTWKWKWLRRVRLFVMPWTIQSMEFSRSDYWFGEPFSSPGDLPNSEIKPRSPALQVDSLPEEPQGQPSRYGVWF